MGFGVQMQQVIGVGGCGKFCEPSTQHLLRLGSNI